MKRKVGSVIMALALCAVLLPGYARADGAVEVSSAAELVTQAATANNSIKLTADVTITSTVLLANGVTIDGDGHIATVSTNFGFRPVESVNNSTAAIQNLKITGLNQSGDGAAVNVSNGTYNHTVNLENCDIYSNSSKLWLGSYNYE